MVNVAVHLYGLDKRFPVCLGALTAELAHLLVLLVGAPDVLTVESRRSVRFTLADVRV